MIKVKFSNLINNNMMKFKINVNNQRIKKKILTLKQKKTLKKNINNNKIKINKFKKDSYFLMKIKIEKIVKPKIKQKIFK